MPSRFFAQGFMTQHAGWQHTPWEAAWLCRRCPRHLLCLAGGADGQAAADKQLLGQRLKLGAQGREFFLEVSLQRPQPAKEGGATRQLLYHALRHSPRHHPKERRIVAVLHSQAR